MSMRAGSVGRCPSGAANSWAASLGLAAIRLSDPEDSLLTAVSGLAGSTPALSQSVTWGSSFGPRSRMATARGFRVRCTTRLRCA